MNQKQRTRTAIVTVAQRFLEQGITPTVAQAAEAALVSRTTAYRYFPTQESLLVEVALNADVDDIEALVAQPVDAGNARQRVLDVVDEFNRHVFDAEVHYRTALRLYLDQSLAAAAHGEDVSMVREGRRRRWLGASLAPLASEIDPVTLGRLVVALSMLSGPEAMVVLRDVCELDAAEGKAVARWAAEALLDAALRERATSASPGKRGAPRARKTG